jgi:hypothetical protein
MLGIRKWRCPEHGVQVDGMLNCISSRESGTHTIVSDSRLCTMCGRVMEEVHAVDGSGRAEEIHTIDKETV